MLRRHTFGEEVLVMSRDEVRAFDRHAIEVLGIPGVVLMENAGRSCAELIREKTSGVERPSVCVFCGTGNNGGDGFVIARHLLGNAFDVRVVLCGDRQRVRGYAKVNLDVLERMGQRVEVLDCSGDDVSQHVRVCGAGADFVVDALFGTGLRGSLKEPYAGLVRSINDLGRPILAVDIPSGLDCDTGEPLGETVRAACTVTFVAVKRGFVASSLAAQYTGEVYVASIGVEPR